MALDEEGTDEAGRGSPPSLAPPPAALEVEARVNRYASDRSVVGVDNDVMAMGRC